MSRKAEKTGHKKKRGCEKMRNHFFTPLFTTTEDYGLFIERHSPLFLGSKRGRKALCDKAVASGVAC